MASMTQGKIESNKNESKAAKDLKEQADNSDFDNTQPRAGTENVQDNNTYTQEQNDRIKAAKSKVEMIKMSLQQGNQTFTQDKLVEAENELKKAQQEAGQKTIEPTQQ